MFVEIADDLVLGVSDVLKMSIQHIEQNDIERAVALVLRNIGVNIGRKMQDNALRSVFRIGMQKGKVALGLFLSVFKNLYLFGFQVGDRIAFGIDGHDVENSQSR